MENRRSNEFQRNQQQEIEKFNEILHQGAFMQKSDTEKQIVDQKHQYWRAVHFRLNDGLINKGKCDHSFDTVEQILFSLPGVDVGGTLDFYMDNGGYCDCEILFNVYS